MSRDEVIKAIETILESSENDSKTVLAYKLMDYIETVMIPSQSVNLSHLKGVKDNAWD